jgi:hypothetical protein
MNDPAMPPEVPQSASQNEAPFYQPPQDPMPNEPAIPHDGLYGLGGWLIWFQLRIYLGIIRAFNDMSTLGIDMFVVISIGLLIVCLVFFYRKKMVFRIWYIASIGAIALDYLYYISMGLAAAVPILIASLMIESLFVVALFRSKRVKNTFR